MVRQQLGELAGAVAARFLDPRGSLGMRRPSLRSEQARVGDIADQDVLEDVLTLVLNRGRDALEYELAAAEGSERGVEIVELREARQRAVPEDPSHHSRALS